MYSINPMAHTLDKPELLAPAGTLRKGKLAIDYGADAIFCGTNIFALRQHKGNFSYEQLQEMVEYAHERGKKVYVTVNVFAHNHHIKVITRALKKLEEIKPDALIVSDAGVFSLIKEVAPSLPIHISTQASITNSLGVKFWADQGAERVILARELNLREIGEMYDQFPDIEIETFVHGAQCMAYSGRCMLSSYMTDSHKANHGSCANNCRWHYKEVKPKEMQFVESQRPDEIITVEEDENGTYIFNANDMCLVDRLDELADAGIVSFKIEGRGRGEFYAAQIVKAYREAIDLIGSDDSNKKDRLAELKAQLLRRSSRDFDTGFFFGSPKQSLQKRTEKSTEKFVGTITNIIDEHTADVLVKNEIYKGETVHVMMPGEEYELVLDTLTLEDGTEVESAHGGKQDTLRITFPKPVHQSTILWMDMALREASPKQ